MPRTIMTHDQSMTKILHAAFWGGNHSSQDNNQTPKQRSEEHFLQVHLYRVGSGVAKVLF